MIKKLLNTVVAQKTAQRQAELYRNLIRHEAKIGGQVFGPLEAGRQREFFCLDRHTWVWHEEWTDDQGQVHAKMTRYDVRPDGVLKAQDGHYQAVSIEEAQNLLDAALLYQQRVNKEIYGFLR